VGEALLILALLYEFDELAAALVVAGADPGVGQPSIAVLTSERTPFGLALSRGCYADAIRMLPAAFMTSPGSTLKAALLTSDSARKASLRCLIADPPAARKLLATAQEAEFCALALLQTLSEARTCDLLASRSGELFLRMAARLESAIILSQPIVQVLPHTAARACRRSRTPRRAPCHKPGTPPHTIAHQSRRLGWRSQTSTSGGTALSSLV
jgi:hypothetical protein